MSTTSRVSNGVLAPRTRASSSTALAVSLFLRSVSKAAKAFSRKDNAPTAASINPAPTSHTAPATFIPPAAARVPANTSHMLPLALRAAASVFLNWVAKAASAPPARLAGPVILSTISNIQESLSAIASPLGWCRQAAHYVKKLGDEKKARFVFVCASLSLEKSPEAIRRHLRVFLGRREELQTSFFSI